MFKDFPMTFHVIAEVLQPRSLREELWEIPMGRKVPEGIHPTHMARRVHAQEHLSTVH
jgi:hypothetical protein